MKYKAVGLLLVFAGVSTFMIMKGKEKKSVMKSPPQVSVENNQPDLPGPEPIRHTLNDSPSTPSPELQEALAKYIEGLELHERGDFEAKFEQEYREEMANSKERKKLAFKKLQELKVKPAPRPQITKNVPQPDPQEKAIITAQEKHLKEIQVKLEEQVKQGQAQAKELKKEADQLRANFERDRKTYRQPDK